MLIYSQIVRELRSSLKERFYADEKGQAVCLQLLKEKPVAQIIKDSINDQSRLYCLRIPVVALEVVALEKEKHGQTGKPLKSLYFDLRDPKPFNLKNVLIPTAKLKKGSLSDGTNIFEPPNTSQWINLIDLISPRGAFTVPIEVWADARAYNVVAASFNEFLDAIRFELGNIYSTNDIVLSKDADRPTHSKSPKGINRKSNNRKFSSIKSERDMWILHFADLKLKEYCEKMDEPAKQRTPAAWREGQYKCKEWHALAYQDTYKNPKNATHRYWRQRMMKERNEVKNNYPEKFHGADRKFLMDNRSYVR